MKRLALAAFAALSVIPSAFAQGADYQALVASHAAANGLPPSLVHRVIMRESRYNPRAVSRGNYGIMQIRLQTARGLGYTGTAQGLLDPETNMTYAVRYLAGAYRAAGGNADRAVRYYASGYYYAAKRQRLMDANAMMIPTNAAEPTGFIEPTSYVERPHRRHHRRYHHHRHHRAIAD